MSVQTDQHLKLKRLAEVIDKQDKSVEGLQHLETAATEFAEVYALPRPPKETNFLFQLKYYGNCFFRMVATELKYFNEHTTASMNWAWNFIVRLVLTGCYSRRMPAAFSAKGCTITPTLEQAFQVMSDGQDLSVLQLWSLVKNDQDWSFVNFALACLENQFVDSRSVVVQNYEEQFLSKPRMVKVMDLFLEKRFLEGNWVDLFINKLNPQDPFPKIDDSVFDYLGPDDHDQTKPGDEGKTKSEDNDKTKAGEDLVMPSANKKLRTGSTLQQAALEMCEKLGLRLTEVAEAVHLVSAEFPDSVCTTTTASNPLALELPLKGDIRVSLVLALASLYPDGDTEGNNLIQELMRRVPVSLLLNLHKAPAVSHAYSAFQAAAEAFQVTSLLQFDVFLVAVLVGIRSFNFLAGLYWLDVKLKCALEKAINMMRIQLCASGAEEKNHGKMTEFLKVSEQIMSPVFKDAGKAVDAFPYAASMMIELAKIAKIEIALNLATVEGVHFPSEIDGSVKPFFDAHIVFESVLPSDKSFKKVLYVSEIGDIQARKDISGTSLAVYGKLLSCPRIGWQPTNTGGYFFRLNPSRLDIAKLTKTFCDTAKAEGRRVLQKHPTAKDVLINHKATLMKVVQDILPPPELPLDSAPPERKLPKDFLKGMWSRYKPFTKAIEPDMTLPIACNGTLEFRMLEGNFYNRDTNEPVAIHPVKL